MQYSYSNTENQGGGEGNLPHSSNSKSYWQCHSKNPQNTSSGIGTTTQSNSLHIDTYTFLNCT